MCHGISSSSSDAGLLWCPPTTKHFRTALGVSRHSPCPDSMMKAYQVHESTQSTPKSTVVLVPCISSGQTGRFDFQARTAKVLAKSTWRYLCARQNSGQHAVWKARHTVSSNLTTAKEAPRLGRNERNPGRLLKINNLRAQCWHRTVLCPYGRYHPISAIWFIARIGTRRCGASTVLVNC